MLVSRPVVAVLATLAPLGIATTLATLAAAARAQPPHIGPSVLAMQQPYHLGTHAVEVAIPSGALWLGAKRGTVDSNGNLTMNAVLDHYEFTATAATLVPAVQTPMTYHVDPDGQIELDIDPQNPGTELLELFLDANGARLHTMRHALDEEAECIVALAKANGMGQGSLLGDYHFYTQHTELVGSAIEAFAEWGTISFDGVGTAAITGTEMSVDVTGTATTSPIAASESYTVAGDGTMTLDSGVGAVAADGSVFFLVLTQLASKEVGLVIGVKAGASYDHRNITGRYSTQGLELGMRTFPTLGNAAFRFAIIDGRGGAAGAAGAGAVDVGLPIPSVPGLAGIELFAQALALDPGGPGGVAMSSGCHCRLGP
jgi:hypothetical protein